MTWWKGSRERDVKRFEATPVAALAIPTGARLNSSPPRTAIDGSSRTTKKASGSTPAKLLAAAARGKSECGLTLHALARRDRRRPRRARPDPPRRLTDGGPDDFHHVIALCPTCQRRVHHGADGESFNEESQEGARGIGTVWGYSHGGRRPGQSNSSTVTRGGRGPNCLTAAKTSSSRRTSSGTVSTKLKTSSVVLMCIQRPQ